MRGRVFLATLVALLALPASGALAASRAYSAKVLHFAVHVGPGAKTRCVVIGELFKPKSASAAHPVPAVLTTNGFGGSYKDQIPLAENLAQNGFVALTYSGLGFGGSSCRISMDSPQWDGQTASQLITFLGGGAKATNGTSVDYVVHDKTAHNGKHYRYDPRVGMIGGSYGGEVQFAAADVDPRLDTIVPMITWNNLQYSLAPNDSGQTGDSLNSSTPGVTKLQWLNGFVFYGEGTSPVAPFGGATTCPNFAGTDCPVITQLDTDGYPDAATSTLAASYSVSSYMSHIKIPVMLMQGEDDTLFNLNEAVATYDALRAQHTPVKMVWQSWGHSSLAPAPGELGNGLAVYNANGSTSVEGLMIKEWFDHYLKGTGPTPALNFNFFRPWVQYSGDDAAAAYASATSYPIATATPFYLSGTPASGTGATAGAASLAAAAGSVASGTFDFTTPAAGAPESTTDAPGEAQSSVALTDPAGSYAEFESAPLSSDTDVVGAPTVTLTAQATASAIASQELPSDISLFVKVEDIAPDGTATLPDRLIGVARFPDDGSPVTITLPAIVHEFPAGDRVALIVAGSDSAYFEPYTSAPITITTSASSPGVLDLPVAGSGSYTSVVYTSK